MIVPKEKFVDIELNEEISATLQQTLGTAGNDGMTQGALHNMHQTLGASFWNENSGGVERALNSILGENILVAALTLWTTLPTVSWM